MNVKENNRQKLQFFVELKAPLQNYNLAHLRMLYGPIIGNDAVMLYQLFFDYHYINRDYNTFYSLDELVKITKTSQFQIINERKKLEAVGLLRVFEKGDDGHFIVVLVPPHSPEVFKKNHFLYHNFIKVADEILFERMTFFNKVKTFDKSEFVETTTKYQDLFAVKIAPKQLDNNTLEVAVPSSISHQEAIENLTWAQYIFYCTKKRASPSQLQIFQNLAQLGFSNQSLNHIINYSYQINNKVVGNHVKKIAEDLAQKQIKDSTMVADELKQAFLSKKGKYFNVPDKQTPTNNYESQDWDDLFNALGGI